MTCLTALRTKSIPILILVLAACIACCVALPARALADELQVGSSQLKTQDTIVTKNYSLNKQVDGKTESGTTHAYSFTLNSDADVNISISNKGNDSTDYFYAWLEDESGSTYFGYKYSSIGVGETTTGSTINLPKGRYKVVIEPRAGFYSFYGSVTYFAVYSFKVTTITPKVSLGKTKGNLRPNKEVEIPFTYNTSDSFAKNNLKITKNTQPKVASASIEIGENGAGYLKINPKNMGKTSITLKMTGGSKATYTATITKSFAYVAKGQKVALNKPIGVKKIRFANLTKASKKIAKVTKKGIATGYKQGRAAMIGRAGKTTYSYTTVVTDYLKLARESYRLIDEYAPDPDLVTINYAYQGLCRKIYVGHKVPAVYLDISYTNEAGGRTRSKVLAWYDDALDIQTSTALTENALMNKKAMNKKAIKG